LKTFGTIIFSIAITTDIFCLASNQDLYKEISFLTTDKGNIVANLYGKGDHAVVLAHGAIFNKESWHHLAVTLSEHDFMVMSIDFRGYGKSVAGSKKKALDEDVTGAFNYLKSKGAKKISLIGGSMGGGAVAQAATMAQKGNLYRVILLSPVPIGNPEQIKADKLLFIASKDERMMPRIQEQYNRAPQPKTLELLEGNAHAQHIFNTDKAQRLTDMIIKFLSDTESINQ
jgi:pimeloyl-ACP methyl ester carboxylesterase